MDEQITENLLNQLRTGGGLQTLKTFFSALNYTITNKGIDTNDLDPRHFTDAQIIAEQRPDDGAAPFHILYLRLTDEGWKAPRTTQRAFITTLQPRYPYALYVFSDPAQTHWHFVNVKQTTGNARQRTLRRISVSPQDRLRTAIERLSMLEIPTTSYMLFGLDGFEIQRRHEDAFDVEAVTNTFFREYADIFKDAEERIIGLPDPAARRLFTQKLFNRLMFILFLERKGWLQFPGMRDREYLRALWSDYQANRPRTGSANFYTERLHPLFFLGLNNRAHRDLLTVAGHDDTLLHQLIGTVPYLNGGLFDPDPTDQDPAVYVPDDAIAGAIDKLFYRFNFTVSESTPLDVEVAVDPEMLGQIFERLVTGRHESGSYYTPKSIVSYMSREALKGHLRTHCPKETEAALAEFVDDQDASQLKDPETVLTALKTVRICDPACGSGAYLLGMMQELFTLRHALFTTRQRDPITDYQRKLDIIDHNLYGVDLDEFAVNIARLRLWLSLSVEDTSPKPQPLPNLDFKIEVGDSVTGRAHTLTTGTLELFTYEQFKSLATQKQAYLRAHATDTDNPKPRLRADIEATKANIRAALKLPKTDTDGFDWLIEFSEVMTKPVAQGEGLQVGGFDIIIANPPYVRHELIKHHKKALAERFGKLHDNTADLYVYFYLRALELLTPNGQLAFITSNKWLRAGYGQKLRKHLRETTLIRAIIDFGDLPVFGAIAYPCIVLAQKTTEAPPDTHTFTGLNVTTLETIPRLTHALQTEAWNLPQTSLREQGWSLQSPDMQRLMDKLRKAGQPLGDYVDGNLYRGVLTGFNDAFVIDAATRERLIEADPRSAELIKPWLRGRDVKRWRANWSGLYVIFTRRGVDIDQYPAIRDHLARFKDRLMPGVQGGRKAGSYQWYEIQDNIAYYQAFEQPKIIYQEIATYQAFAYEKRTMFLNNKCFILPTDEAWLTALLNSRVIWFFLGWVVSKLQGGAYAMQSPYIKEIPVPNLSDDLKSRLTDLVLEISQETTSKDRMTVIEHEINRAIYQAYGLTPAEIALIDSEPRTIAEIQADHPNRWLIIEIKERDPETNRPTRGVLLAHGADEYEADDALGDDLPHAITSFYNAAPQDTADDE